MSVEAILISLAIGVVIPLLTNLLAKENVSAGLKALIAGLLAAVSGALSGALTSPPKGVGAWEQILLGIAVAWVAALTSYVAAYKPLGVSAWVERKTARIGVGRPQVAAPPFQKAA